METPDRGPELAQEFKTTIYLLQYLKCIFNVFALLYIAGEVEQAVMFVMLSYLLIVSVHLHSSRKPFDLFSGLT